MDRKSNDHYVNRSYLKGFTATGRRSGDLWRLDLNERRWRSRKPANECRLPGFYTLDVDGKDAAIVEKEFERVETRATPAIARIINRRLPLLDGDMDAVLNLISMTWIRNPVVRAELGDGYRRCLEDGLLAATNDARAWIELVASFDQANAPLPTRDRHEMREMIVQGTLQECWTGTVLEDRSIHLRHIAMLDDTVRPALYARRWDVLRTERIEAPFITSDRPVILYRADRSLAPDGPLSFLDPTTFVLMPLSKEVALIGGVVNLGIDLLAERQLVAETNALVVANAEQCVYAPHDRFPYLTREGMVTDDTEAILAGAHGHCDQT